MSHQTGQFQLPGELPVPRPWSQTSLAPLSELIPCKSVMLALCPLGPSLAPTLVRPSLCHLRPPSLPRRVRFIVKHATHLIIFLHALSRSRSHVNDFFPTSSSSPASFSLLLSQLPLLSCCCCRSHRFCACTDCCLVGPPPQPPAVSPVSRGVICINEGEGFFNSFCISFSASSIFYFLLFSAQRTLGIL